VTSCSLADWYCTKVSGYFSLCVVATGSSEGLVRTFQSAEIQGSSCWTAVSLMYVLQRTPAPHTRKGLQENSRTSCSRQWCLWLVFLRCPGPILAWT